MLDGEDSVTEKVVREFDDARITLVPMGNIVGGSQARNVGVRKAKGRYIALLDDDDEWMPAKLQRQMEMADAHEGANLCCGDGVSLSR